MAKAVTTNWLLPLGLLVVAVILLITLQQFVGFSPTPQQGPEIPRGAAIEAVQAAPADPFRFGGRNVGTVLDKVEPQPGWTDTGWSVDPAPGSSGYRAVRRYVGPTGAERVYAFTVADNLDTVWPANGRARALMHKGQRPPAK
ncbi:hypothetical protein [Thiohalorhabdus sp.]|uniref:hypothetical protein n=1 Tax=Thiohalorhabdus sp. TaxID=3094134 RepID=UPI002FC34353